MKQWNQTFQKLALLFLITALLAACTGSKTEGDSQEGGEPPGTKPVAAEQEPQKPETKPDGLTLPLTSTPITYSYFLSERADAPVKQDWEIMKKMQERTGVTIQFEPTPHESFEEKKMILIATDSIPDIFSNLSAAEARQYGPDGLFLNFKPYMDKGLMPNVAKWYEKYPDAAVLSTAPDGGIYAIPVFAEENYLSFAWMGRKDILDELGLSMPQNTEQFYQVLKRLKEAYPDSHPFIMDVLDPFGRYGLYRDFTQMFTETDGVIGYNFRTNQYEFAAEMPEFKEMLVFLNKLYAEKLLDPEFALMPPGQLEERLLTGKAFITNHFKGRIDTFTQKARQADANTTYLMNPLLPFALEGKEPFQIVKPVVFELNNIALSAKVKNPEIAVQFIDYLYSEEGTDLTNLGLDGVTYRIDDGKPRYLEEIEKDLVATLRRDYGVVYDGIRMAGHNKSQAARTVTDDIALTDEMYAPFAKQPAPIRVPNDQENELEKEKLPNLKKHFEQKLTEFVMGKTPITDENLKKFIDQSNQLGATELVDVYNQQLARSR